MLLILWARRRIVMASTVVMFVIATTAGQLLPKVYRATSTLVVDARSSDPMSGATIPLQLIPGYLSTQADIVTSRKIALKVVEQLGLTDDLYFQEKYRRETKGKGDFPNWLAEELLRHLYVGAGRDSSVLDISFESRDAKQAMQVANAFADAYIQANLEFKVGPARQNLLWFDQQLKVLRDSFKEAQEKLSAFQRENGIVAVDEKLDVENARLAELSSQLVSAQAETYALLSKQNIFSANGTLNNIESAPEVLANSAIETIKTDLAKKEADLAELSRHLGKDHPQFMREQAAVDSLRARLQTEVHRIKEGVENSLRVSQQQSAKLQNAAAAQKAKVLEIKRQRDNLSMLSREAENAQRAYDNAMQRYGQTSLESQVNQTNVMLLNPAIEPIKPTKPKLWLNMALGLVFGMMLGVALACLLEFKSPRIRSEFDLESETGVPVLTSF